MTGKAMIFSSLMLMSLVGCQESSQPVTTTKVEEPGSPNEPASPDSPKGNEPGTGETKDKVILDLLLGHSTFSTNFDLGILGGNAELGVPVYLRKGNRNFLWAAPLDGKSKVVAISDSRDNKIGIDVVDVKTKSVFSFDQTRSPQWLGELSVAPSRNQVSYTVQNGFYSSIRFLNLSTGEVSELPKPEIEKTIFNDSMGHFSLGDRFVFLRIRETKNDEDKTEVTENVLVSVGDKLETLYSPTLGEKVLDIEPSRGDDQVALIVKTGSQFELLLLKGNQVVGRLGQTLEKAFEPRWFPDGKRLLYWTEDPSGATLWILDVATLDRKKLTNFVAPEWFSYRESRWKNYDRVCPLLSGDGKFVYYASNVGYWDSLFKVRLSDGAVSQLTDPSIPPGFFCPILVGEQ